MARTKHNYIIEIQYLGYRFHGWQKQKDVKTVHLMIDKTLKFVFGHDNFKTHGTSRTDALVSANKSAFELFLNFEINKEEFLKELNLNFPADIKANSIVDAPDDFNIIQSSKTKEYLYLFSSEQKPHPFSASILYNFYDLDIELMKQGAKLFQGEHNFKLFCSKAGDRTDFTREIILSEIVENDVYTASFFPKNTYLFRVKSKGFMRNQVRLMMGQLIKLGQGEISLKTLETYLSNPDIIPFLNYIAPASGLILQDIEFD
jgi:tRNA pseudouridine38-40 synthase